MAYTKGIDVSTHQDDSRTPERIDWTKPATIGARFVINRGVNATTLDQDFIYNYHEQRKHGYIQGNYGFYEYRAGYPTPTAQALALAQIERQYPSHMPVVWGDFEKPGADWPALPPRLQMLDRIQRYLFTLEDATGKQAGSYMNVAMIQYLMSDAGRRVDLPAWLRARPLWIAAWPTIPAGWTPEGYINYWNWTPNLYSQWEKFTIWQYTAKGPGKAAGMESYGLDMDYYNGTEAELRAWCNLAQPEPQPEPTDPGEGEPMENPYKSKAIGLYAKTLADPGWGNTGFDFYMLQGCAGYEQPNPELKPMEARARERGKVVLINYDFSMEYYTRQQYPYDPAKWPPYEQDYPLRAFVETIQNRQPDAVVITVLDPRDHTGNPGGANWLQFASREFITRAKKWIAEHKPGVPVYVRTSQAFLQQYAPAALNWIHQHETIADQPAATPLDASYPQATDRVSYIGMSDAPVFWKYHPILMLYKGTPAELAAAYGQQPTEPGTDPDPGTDPEPEPTELEKIKARLDKLEAYLASLPKFTA